jgi:hypothetical protein
MAVAVGADVLSIEPKLERLMGLVCMLSLVTCRGQRQFVGELGVPVQ